jgi:RHS repeat-associated protein
VRYEYADGRLAGVTSPGGIRTRYEYSEGRLTSETVGDAAKPAYLTEYDADGRVVAQTDAKGGRSTWSWDTEGIRGTSTMTDATGGKWINEYERNWLIRQTDPTGATATFHYDAPGNLIRVFDSLGHSARHEYDALGRVVASTDAVGAVTRRTYDALNDVVATVDPLGRRTTYTYDGRGNLTGTAYGGRTSSVSYDARGLVTASRDALGHVSQYAYSADGDLTTVTDALRQVTRIEYDGWGRPIKTTSPRGAVSTITYNDDDQPLSQHGALDVSTSQTYDGQGRVSTLVDARGGTTKLRYDDAGAIIGVTRPSLPEATTTFDASGRVTETVDASGRSQTFTYDGAGRTTEATYGGRTWKFAYDKAGRLIRTTLPSGKTASFVLDARGAPLRIAYSDKTPAVSYTWDAAGRRTSMTDGLGRTRFGYDAFDQLTSAGAVSYRWDAAGNLTGRTAAGHTESYTWDAVNRLSSVAADGKPLASYRYDVRRGTITTTQPGGLVKTEQLDVRGRTTSLSIAQSGRPPRTMTSAYDAADNLTRSDDSMAGKSSYSYDPLNRLTAACYGVDQCTDDATDYIRYDYDANGNRTWEKRPSGSTWSLYGSPNELQASLTTPANYPLDVPITRRYTYDPDGNLTFDGTTTYTWSAAGKPITSTTAGVETTYTHTGDGRRATSTTGPQTTRYLWDPLSPQILSTTGPSQPTRYLYGSGLLAQQTPSARTPLTTTPNGSVLTATTTKPEQHNYEPYGQTRAGPTKQTTQQEAPGYIGGLKLPTGNYLLGQREYNPTTGTFLTTDQAGSANPYAYTAGNPLKTTDLQGLDDIEGTLTDVSHVSGYVSTAALGGAVICTVARACAPAIPILLQISSATGVVSAGAAGILDSQACVLKGNCSQLVADVAVGLVATRFPALGRARNDSLTQAVRLGPDSARTLAARNGLETQLSRKEADAISSRFGYLKPEVIDSSREILRGEDLGNPSVIRALTADGSKIEDWGKYSTKTYRSPSGPFQVHFYYNNVTGRVNYNIDYKVKFN